MKPLPFTQLGGKYAAGEVVLSWKYPSHAPDSVYVIPVYGKGITRRVNINELTERPLRSVSSEFRFRFQSRSEYDVMKCEFLAFLGERGCIKPDVEFLLKNPGFSVSVFVGRAHVYYWVDTKKSDAGFERHTISLDSGYSIEKGILGYSFSTGLQTFNAQFPESIKKGKTTYPPFFTKTGSYVKVGSVEGANAEVTSEVKRIFRLGSYFNLGSLNKLRGRN